jgi:hypothetical protein
VVVIALQGQEKKAAASSSIESKRIDFMVSQEWIGSRNF